MPKPRRERSYWERFYRHEDKRKKKLLRKIPRSSHQTKDMYASFSSNGARFKGNLSEKDIAQKLREPSGVSVRDGEVRGTTFQDSHPEHIRFMAARGVGRRGRSVRELPIGATYYPPGRYFKDRINDISEDDTYTIEVCDEVPLTTDGSGLIASVYSDDPSGTADWASYVDVYEEYRVLYFQVDFRPLHQAGGSTATFWAPIASVVDRSDAVALTGYSAAEEFSSVKEFGGGRAFHRFVPMDGTGDATFLSTASTVAKKWIKFYSSGNSNSLTVGRVMKRYLVQFRGRGLT